MARLAHRLIIDCSEFITRITWDLSYEMATRLEKAGAPVTVHRQGRFAPWMGPLKDHEWDIHAEIRRWTDPSTDQIIFEWDDVPQTDDNAESPSRQQQGEQL